MDVTADIFPDDTHDHQEAYARTKNDLEAAQEIVLKEAHVPSTVHGGQVAFNEHDDGAGERNQQLLLGQQTPRSQSTQGDHSGTRESDQARGGAWIHMRIAMRVLPPALVIAETNKSFKIYTNIPMAGKLMTITSPPLPNKHQLSRESPRSNQELPSLCLTQTIL